MFLKYGDKAIQLSLPEGIPAETLELPELETLRDPLKSIGEALDSPIDLPPLKSFVSPEDKVCLIVNDSTRVANSEIFLPVLTDKLEEAGVKSENIFIVFANGNHRDMDREEMVSLVGEKIADKYAMYNHNCKEDEMVFLGNTKRNTPVYINKRVYDADKRILTGSVVYHFFAGFGGGRKALVPGVSGHETIQANHRLMLEEGASLGKLKQNPVHEDQVEAASMIDNNFLLNVVLNEKKEFLAVYAGEMIKTHLKACEFVEKAYGVKIGEPADLVIASCGGHPKDINIYQAQKTLDNAVQGLKDGGILILIAKCLEGMGSEIFEEWITKYETVTEVEKALQENFVLGGHKAYAIYRAAEKARVLLVSSLDPAQTKKLGFESPPSLENALETALESLPSKPLIYIMPEGSLTVPVLEES